MSLSHTAIRFARAIRGLHLACAILILACALTILGGPAAGPAAAGALQVTVINGLDRTPVSGAFVMVGPAKGIPFAGNTAFTSPTGTVVFTNARLEGPQTVTAGATGFAYTAVIRSAVTAVTLPIFPSLNPGGVYGPKARVTGPVTGIGTVSNDGRFDIGMVLPAITIDQAMGGSLPIEIPPDTTSFPLMGQVVMPGNIVMPTQTEFIFLQFSKPNYKIDLPAQTTQSLYVVSARIPVEALINFPSGGDPMQLLKVAQIREFGIERDRPIGSGTNITIDADINLQTALTVQFNGAPNGTTITAFSLGSLPRPGGGEEVVGYDTDNALVDTLSTFVLASATPTGDIADVSNLVAGTYQDTSAYKAFASGRIDRTAFAPPATRVLADFYAPPTLSRQGARLFWSDVHSGTEPVPTWTLHSISAGPLSPADTSIATTLLWRIIAPASLGELALPELPGGEAPGPPSGLIDVEATPQADRLIWNAWVANPSGDLAHVLTNPMDGVTHFSQRIETLDLKPADAGEPRALASANGLRLSPNPTSGAVGIRFASPPATGARLEVVDASGRRVARIDVACGSSGVSWDGRDESGRRLPPGMYMVRSADGRGSGKVLLIR